MRQLFLILLGIFLIALSGAIYRALHLELIHPDIGLLLVVFTALRMKRDQGIVIVTALGFVADSFAGSPTGMFAFIYLLVWLSTRLGARVFLPDTKNAQYKLIFAMSLFAGLLQIIFLGLAGTGAGPVLAVLKVILPLALIHVLIAKPVWVLAQKTVGLSIEQKMGIS